MASDNSTAICCQWHSAFSHQKVKSASEFRFASLDKSSWTFALSRICNQKKASPRKQPNTPTWYLAYRRLLRRHLSIIRMADNWTRSLETLAQNRVKAKPQEMIIVFKLCPECRERIKEKRPRDHAWLIRCIAQHYNKIARSNYDGWDRKFDAILRGMSRRAKCKPKRKRRPIFWNWTEAFRRSIFMWESRAKWHRLSAWDQWAANTCSNLRKRIRARSNGKGQDCEAENAVVLAR